MLFSRGLKSIACSIGVVVGLAMGLGTCHGQTAKYIVKKTVFHLPFKADSSSLSDIREMELWVRDGAGQWKVMDRVAPSAKHFTCQVPQDGEYGFSIVMMDKSGKASPADVTQRPPELVVLVETKAKGATPIKDAVPPAPAKSSVPPPTLKFSGNQPMPDVNETETEQGPSIPNHETQAPPVGQLPSFTAESLHDAVLQHDAGTSVAITNPARPTTTIQGQAAPTALLVNNPHVSIDYNIKKVGPSGVSKVEVYVSKDLGKTWSCVGVDTEMHGPIEVALPGEGVYGIRMVGINGNGFGGKKPGPGDRPSTIIEVDMTKPNIQGWKVVTGKNGNLDVYWKVTDKNLGSEPINLYYRTRAEMAWKPLALKVKNDGVYHWSISQDLAPQYFVRMDVSDRAGNVATCETANPILVDRSEPEIRVQGVTVVPTRAEEPGFLVPPSFPEN